MNFAFIELSEGIIINMDLINFIRPANTLPSPNASKQWTVMVGGASININNDEYETIKSYYESINSLY